jgi:hypothetical protein
MSREPPCWSPDVLSGAVLMEYLKRVSPQFVAAELNQLGLLNAADEVAAATLAKVARRASLARQKLVAAIAVAMCAAIVVIAQTRNFGAVNLLEEDGSPFMQLAGPTPEW